ncbi:MgtC/SapB family protein [Rhodococcus sp. D2-41]|uniref:MgtC/SapB family protein n=1 Tax=Speluncibacter jeojiensis TaxID=2710754 RepID=A0A9X4LY78_9ACTN|nr:MgtC/SapB family protein [Rhodococcus sp. D2-41]MDG3009799.1 MgtC/SapB family protein [Rhodococcus sp. D2-41]MDG3014550.1 MgtC/SapB family protein [Corynebacteriales bacterium D3-21]
MGALATAGGPLALAAQHGQGWPQVGELLVAFVLSALIGFEREIRGKNAGLRTQAIVGTTAALIVLVSKYGFGDVLAKGYVILDPSRVAAQIVTGIGFLGAGLIITRQGAIRGLTTAASVWETAAIGMAAGAGLPLLAVLVTVLHFVVVLGLGPLIRRIPARLRGSVRIFVIYEDGRGILRQLLTVCSTHNWVVTTLSDEPSGTDLGPLHGAEPGRVGIMMSLSGRGVHQATNVIGAVDGVDAVHRVDESTE